MSKIVLSEFREVNFLVEFSIEINNGDNFLVSSELVESDPLQFAGSLIDYLESSGMANQNFIKLIDSHVIITGIRQRKFYTEDELKDSCVAEVFVENLFDLFCGA
ncbi:hypothetical protein OTK49_01890 [Vibrio coralliirubri]|uniref:hypothetical protein n=1 Tax=Vibrio coralliirubri TaxID=1516159 RepID=UPI0022836DBB|nr:hypothetical protein [Vibrio coralliirubri]MCY9861265.1 hypothetical protein [Vibrio coralliirubri]